MRFLASVLLFALAACDGQDPVSSATRDTVIANQAAAAKGGEVAPAGPASDNANAARTNERLGGAGDRTFDQTFTADMIAHDQEAVAMAKVALEDITDPTTRRMAQAIIDTRTREIAEMRAVATTNPN